MVVIGVVVFKGLLYVFLYTEHESGVIQQKFSQQIKKTLKIIFFSAGKTGKIGLQ